MIDFINFKLMLIRGLKLETWLTGIHMLIPNNQKIRKNPQKIQR